MEENDLGTQMISRLGKVCTKNIVLVDKAKQIVNPYETDKNNVQSSLVKYIKKSPQNFLDVEEILKAEAKKKQQEENAPFFDPEFCPQVKKESKAKLDDPLKMDFSKIPKKKPQNIEGRTTKKFNAIFKVSQRKPLNFESVFFIKFYSIKYKAYSKKPAVGQYYPHIDAIMPTNPTFYVPKSAKTCYFEEIAKKMAQNTTEMVVVNRKEKPKGTVGFERQSKRDDLMLKCVSAHESRFESINKTPSVLSSFKKMPTLNFAKLKGRAKHIFAIKSTGIQYNPKLSFVSQSIFLFDKL